MTAPLSVRQRKEQEILNAPDSSSVYFIFTEGGLDEGGRRKRAFHSLENPFPGVDNAIPAFTSRRSAEIALDKMKQEGNFDTDGLRIGGPGGPGANWEKRQSALLDILDDHLLPDCFVWFWSGSSELERDIPRCTRRAIRRSMLGFDAYWDQGPNSERLK